MTDILMFFLLAQGGILIYMAQRIINRLDLLLYSDDGGGDDKPDPVVCRYVNPMHDRDIDQPA